ncbi:UDP glucuronosyltransferase 5 family, polypeptide D1 [Aplochiton taeniatus]
MSSSCGCGALVFLALCLSLLLVAPCKGGKVLVFPVDGSHWINMNVLIEELHARGHTITVLRSSTSWYIKEKSPLYDSITFTGGIGMEDFFQSFLKEHMKAQRAGASGLTFLKLTRDFMIMLSEAHRLACKDLSGILEDKEMVKKLRETQYDVFLTDPAIAGGLILAKYLHLPVVLNVRWITSGEGHFIMAPSPLSYIPVPGSGLTDKMSFLQRVQNTLFHLTILTQQTLLVGPSYTAVCDKYFEAGCDIITLLQEADIWLFRSDFVFDFPRPTMPNVVYIGGFQCKPAQPLPSDLEEFVQSAGEHGVIVMTLGTLVHALPIEVADQIASVFARMPQKVIWRHVGARPSTLGNNTRLVDWMPQKDLLGHPQTRAFVAHGGTNGVQEAIYHGCPVLGIPLFFDQFDNLLRLRERGAGQILDLAELNGHTFEEALKEVLYNPSYRDNMQRMSRLHRDQPITPMDNAVFWLEYVMRNQGAAHLRTQAYRMPWYSYYSVDVVLVLLAASTLFLLPPLVLCKRLCCRGSKKNKTKQQ